MREILLYWVATPFTLWFAYKAFNTALAIYRQDRRERLALALARKSLPFARAYATVKGLGGSIPSVSPWERIENGGAR